MTERGTPDRPPRDTPLLTIDGLSVVARSRAGQVTAVDGLNLVVHPGETIGLIGESGSGKSTTVAALLDLLGPNRHITAGAISFAGTTVYGPGIDTRASLRGGDVGFVFQAAATSLNPTRRIRSQLGELLDLHLGLRGDAARGRMDELLTHLGFDEPGDVQRAYPHQLSGGMAQRVAIAMALAGEPSLLVADEATSALDVVTQETVVGLLRRLVENDGYALAFVTHDIALAAELCDTLVVLQEGVVVERGSVDELLRSPQHPYTRHLIDSVPLIGAPTTMMDAAAHQPSTSTPRTRPRKDRA